MADSTATGQCFLPAATSTVDTSVQGQNQAFITNIQVNGVGLNATPGTLLQITDGGGTLIGQYALALPSAILASYFGSVLSLDGLAIPITYINSPVTVKLNQALSSGTLAINIGFAI
jgi:hypothetical protein